MRLAATAVALLLAWAVPAQAKIIEIGRTDAKPACPSSPCLAVSRTTGYQAQVGTRRGTYVVPADGRIVAWSISLGRPTRPQIKFFNANLGGTARAEITVLRQGKRLFRRVVAKGPVVRLQPYFGQTVQFPLATALDVKKGYVVALTVPTWAPALTQLLSDGSSWRAARPLGKCNDTSTQTAQSDLMDLTQYRCLYKARLTYSATLITRPVPNRNP